MAGRGNDLAAPLDVFLTVDTELWPFAPGWPERPFAPSKKDFSAEIAQYIYGDTPQGLFGLPFQLQVLRDNDLAATFFVESLCSLVLGPGPLAQWTRMIAASGHEIGLHVHTEWLREVSMPGVTPGLREHLHEYPQPEQEAILRIALERLAAAGAAPPVAFRAGSYGASRSTLRALAAVGLRYDTSLNACEARSFPDLEDKTAVAQPALMEGCYEFPVSTFRDYPGHVRPANLCACSAAEMRSALNGAWARGWDAFVIVLHSGELIRRRPQAGRAAPARLLVSRFQALCGFLARHPGRFRTRVFRDAGNRRTWAPSAASLPTSAVHRTAWRMLEQLVSRVI